MEPESYKRKLTAILSADAAGYSRLMAEDEAATVKTLATYREVMATLIKQHRGRIVDSPGDNVLAEFSSVVDAVQCAVAVQNELQTRNAELAENRRMEFRIGINLGDVIDEEDRIYGDGVNIAARLEALADPNGICVSKTAFDQIESKLPLGYEYLGEQSVKNIPKPIGAYRVLMKPDDAGKVIGKKRKEKRFMNLAAVIVLLIGSGGLAGWYLYFEQTKRIEPASVEKMAFPLPEEPSIAVLPFDNLSGDPEQDYIADGFTENIITGLSQIPDIFVIARNSVFTYKGKPVKVKQVSEELGVKFVLEGSIQKAGDRLRVNAQLIDSIKGHHLWAERYDRELKDLFALQDDISLKILNAMEVKLTLGETANWYRTDNFEAWSLFTRGFSLVNRLTKEDLLEARKLFEQAANLEPDYTPAWTMQAWVHTIEVLMGFSKSPGDSINQALELAQKTAALGEDSARLHSLMARIYRVQGRFDEAIAEGEKAVALIPNMSRGHIFLAASLHYGGRPEEAIVHAKKAMRLEPHYPAWFLAQLAGPYDMLGRHEEAIAIWKKYLEQARGETVLVIQHERLTTSYASLNKMEEARFHAAEILKIKPDYTVDSFRKRARFYKDKAYAEKRASLLLKAGLPENTPSQ